MKYVNFNMSDRSLVYYTAIILIVLGHLTHFIKLSTVIIILQISFIIGYSLLTLDTMLKKREIHISTLIYRGIIIIILLFSIFSQLHQS